LDTGCSGSARSPASCAPSRAATTRRPRPPADRPSCNRSWSAPAGWWSGS
jgi:hypothetical protein